MKFQHVNNRWDDTVAAKLSPVELLVYRSNCLGADQRVTNTGGGNTSSKLMEKDPLTGEPVEVLWVKGSGGDLRTAKRENFSSLYQARLLGLQKTYGARGDKGLKSPAEDDMVAAYNHCTFNLNPRASSIDTPLHSFIPAKFVDHMHPNAIIAIAASKRCEELTREIFGGEMAYVPWMRPGFELGLAMQEIIGKNPKAKAIMMGQHGFISWANDDKECYWRTLDFIERASQFIEKKYAANGGDAKAFGGAKCQTLAPEKRSEMFAAILPWLRGQVSQPKRFIATVQDDEKILRFVNSVGRPASGGTGHQLSRPFSADENQAALRGLESADGGFGRAQRKACRRTGTIPEGLRGLLPALPASRLAGHARSESDRHPDSRPGHDCLGQGQKRIARDGGVLQLRRRGHARRGGD